jgi:hypothetical protein
MSLTLEIVRVGATADLDPTTTASNSVRRSSVGRVRIGCRSDRLCFSDVVAARRFSMSAALEN